MNGRFRFFQRWRRIAAFQNPNRQFWVGRIRSLENPDWQRLAGSKHSLKHLSVIASGRAFHQGVKVEAIMSSEESELNG